MAQQPQRQPRSADVQRRLIEAATDEFARRGFEGASTRRIAEGAGTHQPQINYHFGSKLGLWQAVLDDLFAKLDTSLAHLPGGAAESTLREVCRRYVRYAAEHPELNRLMVHESTQASERLDWLVERHIKRRFNAISALCEQLNPAEVPTTDPVIFYYCFVGAASLFAVNSPEADRLVGPDALSTRIDAHADAIALMMLGPIRTPSMP
jgi:AcrR family transcriptional regulator